MKIAELFWQLRGEAGARQVPGTPERGVAQAWGDLMQVGTVVVMAADGVGPAGARRGGGGGPAPLAQPSHAPLRGAAATSSPSTLPPSHPLSDAEFHSAVGSVDDALDISFEWDAGEAMGAFLEGLRDGRIVATHCVVVRADAGAAAEVLRAVLPADGSRGRRSRRPGSGRDVLDLPRVVGHAAAWTRRSCRP